MSLEIVLSAAVLAGALLFFLLYKPKRPAPAGASAPPAPPPMYPPPVMPPVPQNPVQAFMQMGDGHMNAEFAKALGMFQAQKVATELSEALKIIARPAPGTPPEPPKT